MSSLFSPARLWLYLACAAALLAGPAQATEFAPFRIVTANLPPLVVEQAEARPGALFEVVRELNARLQVAPPVDFLPWPRAIFTASSHSRTAIFPLTRLPTREASFRWLVPLYDEQYVFLTPKGSRFDVSRPNEMKDKRIAVLRGGAQIAELRQRGYQHIVEAASIDEVHRFLLGGMADAAVGETAIVRKSLIDRAAVNQFIVSKIAYSNTAWLAGSLDFTDRDVAAFNRAMQQLRADGTYRKILGRYGLE